MHIRALLPSSILIASSLVATHTWAQTASGDSSELQLEEIVVTAERRAEDLQKTAISITAISGDELQKQGDFKVDDVVNAVPGVKVIGGPAGFLVRIRGEGLNVPPTVGDPSVPVMADGLYNAQVTTTFYGIYDIDHVEVLRGPQGTLFGKNSTGGVVNFITANPKDKVEGMASLELGNYSLLHTEAMFNTPLSDSLSFRIATSTVYHDGYLSNGDNGQDSKSARVKLQYKPNDAFSALIGLEYSHNGGTPPGSVLGWGTGDPTVGSPVAGFPPTTGHGSTDPWYDPAPGNNYWKANYERYWADVKYDFGWATLSVLPSFQDFDIKWRAHFAPGGDVAGYQNSLGGYQISHQRQYAGEVHLSSPSEQSFKWLAGLYYYETPNWYSATNGLGTVSTPTCGPNSTTQADIGIYPSCVTYSRTLETIRDYAAFAQTTIPLTDALRLTLGGRITQNKKTMDKVDNSTVATAPYLQYWQAALKTDQFTYKAGLEYDLAANSLLYAQTATGFIAGAFNTFANTTSPAERLQAYEIGTKNRFFNDSLQLNAEIFDNEIKDLQTFYSLPNPYLNGTTITSPQTLSLVVPAKARSYGGEVETSWLFTQQDRLDFTASYLHARFLEFSNAAVGAKYNGGVLPQSPTWSLTAGYDHVFPFSSGAQLTAHAEMSYHTKYYLIFNYKDFPPYSFPPPFPPNEAEVPADHISNASLNYTSASGKWSLAANVKNIENTVTKTGFFGPNVQVSDPRTYSANVTVHFE